MFESATRSLDWDNLNSDEKYEICGKCMHCNIQSVTIFHAVL